MRVYRAEVVIAAPIERVWSILTDFEAYPAWNPFTLQVKTSRVVGEPVDMRVALGWMGVIRQRETLREVAPYRIVWALDHAPRALLWAERVQALEPADGGTRYTTADTIGGALEPVVRLLLAGPLQRGFEQMAAALQARATAPR
jgi:uncharacterized protein YndB with AHSA1/START domain